MDDVAAIPPHARLKRFQRFRDEGPVYEVLGEGKAPGTVHIRILENGEELDYRADRAANDPEADALLGLREFQRFGEIGPAYQVLGPGKNPRTVRVVVLESGEEFDYRLADAKTDPAA